MAKEEQGGGVGPVQVVEHEDQWSAPADFRNQSRHRFEQPVTVHLRIARHRQWRVREPPTELGHESLQVIALSLEDAFDHPLGRETPKSRSSLPRPRA